jgi:hypothetical protein
LYDCAVELFLKTFEDLQQCLLTQLFAAFESADKLTDLVGKFEVWDGPCILAFWGRNVRSLLFGLFSWRLVLRICS